MLVRRIKRLPEIDPRTWEHPADRAALSALKQLKGLDEVVRSLVSSTTERSLYLMHIASSVKVGPNQYPRVHTIVNDIIDVFDWPTRPAVFITQSPFFNAHTFGVEEPFIVINSSLVRTFNDQELKVVVAHEMGHVMSGHALYSTLMWLLTNISMALIPFADLLIMPIMAALAEWNRKSELTADRAALLATQDESPNYNVLMRMAGGDDLTQVNINEFFLQAQEYESRKTMLDSLHKMLNQVWLSHPYPVIRLQELKTWASSGFYQGILDGDYARRGSASSNVKEDLDDAFDFYKQSMRDSDDPLTKMASNFGSAVEKTVGDLGGKLSDWMRKQ